MMKLPPGHQPNMQRGFALLITITLVAFLVLVLVAMASLTRVETRIADNSHQLDQARQNALMALNIAIGQLQKYAGPDQRVTAPADLIADKDKLGVAPFDKHPRFEPANPTTAKQDLQPLAPTVGGTAYVPHIAVQPGARYWTGAWGNSRTASYNLKPDSAEFTPANRGGLMPTQLGWLISGNEQSAFTANTDGSVVAPTAANAPVFSPALTITNLTTASKATDKTLAFPVADTVTGSATTRGVILVGPNSVYASGTLPTEALQDFVVAPTVAITAPRNTIPGLGSDTTPVEVGRYAWWVGDEGVKARVNLQNGYQNPKTGDAAEIKAAQINSFIVAQRTAPEFMDFDRLDLAASVPTTTRIGTDYDFTKTAVANLVPIQQLALLGTDTTTRDRLKQASRNRFHDLTTTSFGVLADTYAGGLKKDITADIAGSTDGPADSDLIFQPASGKSTTHLPTWKDLRAWPRLNPASSGGPIDPTTTAARAAGITPLIAHVSFGMDYFLGITPTGAAPPAYPSVQPDDNTYGSVSLKFAIYPIIVLHNPYSVALGPVGGGPIEYDFGIRLTKQARFIVEADHGGDENFIQVADINLSSGTVTAAGAAVAAESSFRFRVRLDAPIPPGERQAFMLDSSYDDTEYNRASPPVLTRVPLNTQGSAIKQYVYINGPDLVPDGGVRMTNPYSHIRVRAPKLSYADADEDVSLHFTQISAVLAEHNALSSPTWDTSASAQTQWYQSILNVFPGIFRMTGGDTPNGTTGSKGSTFFTEIGDLWVNGLGETFPADQVDNDLVSLGDTIEASELTDKALGAIHLNAFHNTDGGQAFQFIGASGDHFYPRLFANSCLRAPLIQATEMENTRDKFLGNFGQRTITQRLGAIAFAATIHGCGADQTSGNLADAGKADAQLWLNGLRNESIPFGESYFAYAAGSLLTQNVITGHRFRAVLWDILDSKDNLLSLGQFQHALLSPWAFNSSYLFGNSVADYHVFRNTTYNDNLIAPPEGGTAQPVYDFSWLLNRQLWDKYFVSGVPSALKQADIDAGKPLPNARMTYYHQDGQNPVLADVKQSDSSSKAYDRAAANLLVAGSFNINSTSEQAWRAILAGTSGLPHNDAYASDEDLVETAIPYPRFSHNLTATADASFIAYPRTMRPDPVMTSLINPTLPATTTWMSGSDNYVQRYIRPILYYGNRGLFWNLNLNNVADSGQPSANAVVKELARCIVTEVRRRGPFLSLADFINRPLTPSPTSTAQAGDERLLAGIKGALQAALEKMDPTVAQVNPWQLTHRLEGQYPEIRGMAFGNYQYLSDISLKQNLIGGYGTQDKAINDPYCLAETHRSMLTFSPKYISQADMLSTLGPQLSARSDTFTIRTYGETTNPVTGETSARIWCEAVVQRTPEYMDSAGNSAWDATTSLNTTNQNFGRKFQVVSFRWLSPEEI